MVLTLANLEGEESFDASMLGQADEVVQERISDDELIVIKRWVENQRKKDRFFFCVPVKYRINIEKMSHLAV